ncbi:MAG: YqgE/AlgH family protein [Acetobacterales bacterium]
MSGEFGEKQDNGYLPGQLLVAMPQMEDPRFARSVVYLCAHTAEGAMGLVLNRELESLTFPDLLEQLGIEPGLAAKQIRVHFGGPVESSRGFVLHSDDYMHEASLNVDNGIALTATVDILKEIAHGSGPRNCLLALGYAGWGPGQLDGEMHGNAWLHVEADQDLVFGSDLAMKWENAIRKIGVDPMLLSGAAGRA